MARPTSKKDLLEVAEEKFTKLFALVDSFDEEAKRAEYPFDNNRDKNIRDILAHLYHWHSMVLKWYDVGMKGEKPDIPAKGYNWRTTPALNREIWKMYQETSFEESEVFLKGSHKKVMEVIESHSNEELFEKKRYKWTGNNAMGAYFASATSSHYDWAMKHLKRYKKSLKDT